MRLGRCAIGVGLLAFHVREFTGEVKMQTNAVRLHRVLRATAEGFYDRVSNPLLSNWGIIPLEGRDSHEDASSTGDDSEVRRRLLCSVPSFVSGCPEF
jgi:hypothetical protein